MKVDITNRAELNALLNRLTEDTQGQWGLMKAQNMIEHLALVMQHTNGKKQAIQRTTDVEAQKIKEAMIYSEAEIPKGLKSPLAGETADPFTFASLEEARQHLNNELDEFHNYFAANPSATFIQPRMGSLTYNEWIIFHNKHFTHHLKQFGIIT